MDPNLDVLIIFHAVTATPTAPANLIGQQNEPKK